MDLLLGHQNGEFKQFQLDRKFFLQEIDKMFKFHILLIDALIKIRIEINKVIISKE